MKHHIFTPEERSELASNPHISKVLNCLDNAPIERFFGHLKDDVDIKSCQTFEEVKSKVGNYIYY